MRAWVIGNGPSLKAKDLDLLKGETCFATNRIHLMYPHTAWRPTHYVRSEFPYEDNMDLVIDDLQNAFANGLRCWMSAGYRGFVTNKNLRRYMTPTTSEDYFDLCEHGNYHYDDPLAPDRWHLPGLCSFGSSVNVAVQLAVKLGYDEIYLLGCDLGYKDGKPNHFDQDYEKPYEKFREARYANKDTYKAHKIAALCSNVPIFNCTPNGAVDLFPRRALLEVLDGAGLQS